AMAKQCPHVVHLAVARAGVAAAAIDLLHDDRRFGKAETRAAVLLRNQRGEPPGFRQCVDEFVRITARFVDLAKIRIRKLRAQRTDAVADILKAIVHVVATASIARRPSSPFAHSATFPPSPSGRPQTANGAVSNSGLTARNAKRVTRASGRSRSNRSSNSVASSGPCTIRPG